MSTEREELPEEEEARSWTERAAALAASARVLLETRLAIFEEEFSGKASLLGKGLGAIAVAAALGVGALMLLAALLAAILARLFGSAPLGILGAMLIYAAGAALVGRAGWKAISGVKPKDFPATTSELARDWDAIRESFTVRARSRGRTGGGRLRARRRGSRGPRGAPARGAAMTGRDERLAELSRRAASEREDLAGALSEARADISAFRQRWRFAGLAASGLAAAATAAWKLFGRNSLAAKAGRIASAASLLIGLGRGVRAGRRFW